jgi:DNA adenine methylase
MISKSPLRYPGGKTRFTNFIAEAMLSSGEQVELFAEPFCGGAGAAISLLESGYVPQIALNDCDPLVASFWKVVFGKSRKTRHDINWLIHRIDSAKLSVDEWRYQKALKPRNIREAAWKCLYLNRTSFNGILHKAGPIGGWEQKNRTLAVRFNREKLIKRSLELFSLRDQVIRVECMNWKRFCSYYTRSNRSYLYLDPPYYHKAEQLYGYLFDEKAHRELRNYLVNTTCPWMLSYDDASEVRTLYSGTEGIEGRVIDQTYSAHPVGGGSFVGRELFFSNRPLPVPIEQRQHVGLTVVGCFREIITDAIGPLRMSFEQLAAVGT